MTVLFLQLSDIHFRVADNPVLARVEAIKGAVQGLERRLDACILVFTGDIAFSGAVGEYAVAERWLCELRAALEQVQPGLTVSEVFIPGNHDCSLPDEDLQTRELLVTHLLKSEPARSDASKGSVLRKVLQAQDEFFAFASRRLGAECPATQGWDEPEGRLYYVIEVPVGGSIIRFQCLNTAWLSQRNERASELLAPVWECSEGSGDRALTLTLFHHPYTWLEPNNAKALREFAERSSDFVFTGHEHVGHQFTARTIRDVQSEYFEGSVLQESGQPEESGFSTVLVDLAEGSYQLALHRWKGDYYGIEDRTEWRPLEPTRVSLPRHFQATARFAEWLRDPGAAFTHPRRAKLALEDIFVYPHLEDRTLTDDDAEPLIKGEDLLSYVRAHRKVLLIGGEACGRTSLAKRLWLDAHGAGLVPVLVKGNDLRDTHQDALRKTISQLVRDQYGQEQVERFWQLDPAARVFVVDDLQHCKLNRRGVGAILGILSGWSEAMVLFASDLFQVEEVTQQVDDPVAALLLSYRHCTIKPFGYRLRHQLIENWHRLGQEFTLDEEQLAGQVRDAEQLINTLLGQNLLPSYPLFVLSILQAQEARTAYNTALGAYGYHYEALITASLDRAIRKGRSKITVDTIYAFASSVAFRLFEQEAVSLSEAELDAAIGDYKRQMKMRFHDAEMLSLLREARILVVDWEGRYTFAYRYILYYFVARQIRDHLHTSAHGPAARRLVDQMTKQLYIERYANIVIFLVYLTKDERTILTILEHARTTYAAQEPCDLDRHVKFADRLQGNPIQPVALNASDLRANNDLYRKRLDEAEELQIASPDGEGELPVRAGQEIDELSQLNAALKTLQITGQVLRNFPGSLSGELKRELATECYLLGLRTLSAVFAVIEENMELFRSMFSETIRHVYDISDEVELVAATDEALRQVVIACSYWMIRSISRSVGSEQLEETYKEVQDARTPLAIGLIDLSVKLDHFRGFPTEEVDKLVALTTATANVRSQMTGEKVRQRVVRKPFAHLLLRHLVRDYFYLYPAKLPVRQAVCAKLDIRLNDARVFDTRQKQLPART